MDNTSVKVLQKTANTITLQDSKGTVYDVQKVVVTSGAWTNNVLSDAGKLGINSVK